MRLASFHFRFANNTCQRSRMSPMWSGAASESRVTSGSARWAFPPNKSDDATRSPRSMSIVSTRARRSHISAARSFIFIPSYA